MIDELRIYRLAPGALADYLKYAGEVALPFRGDDYGALRGFWHGEIGAVNSAFNLWRHKDLNTRQSLREGLENKSEWRAQYLAKVQPLMQSTVIRLMTPVATVSPPKSAGNIYELRLIRARVGKANELASHLVNELPSPLAASMVGVWLTFAGELHEVVTLCAYPDLRERLAATLQHPGWQDFLNRYGALAQQIDSTLLVPTSFSPMK